MKTKNKFQLCWRCILAISLLLVAACERPGDEIDIPTGPVSTVEYLVEQGWVSYEDGDYSDSKSQFTSAINRDVFYKEAYLGLGWTLNRLSDFNGAIPRFDLLLTLATESDSALELLSYAGKTLSYAGMSSDSLSCLEAENFLEGAEVDYVFEHDDRITTTNLKKLLLNGYWNYQDFYSVQNTIINHFEADWFDNLVITDENLSDVEDISASISVETGVDTSVSPYDTTIISASIELPAGYNLLEVTGISDTLSVTYIVEKFVHGGSTIFIDVDAVTNTAPLLDDLAQPVEVDFIHAADYGEYLNTLMEKVQELY